MTGAVRALAPGAAVLFAAMAFMWFAPDRAVVDVAGTYGLVVYGAGLALAWVFHRSRSFIALGSLALIDITILGEPDRSELLTAFGTIMVLLLGVLAVVRDRGIASRVGSLQLLGAALLATVTALIFADPERVAAFAAHPRLLPLEAVVWPGYPLVTLGVAALTLIGVTYGFYRYRGPVERSLVWGVVLILVAMHPEAGLAGSSLFMMAAGLTLTIGVVETSYMMAYRDELTGLSGRRALIQYLDGIQGMYAVAMVDVDHFKKFNDRHGHDVGDQVLQLVASRLARAPGGARAYRYGGEEFTLILPGRTVEDAIPHLEAVRESVAGARFSLRSWKRPRKKPGAKGSASKKSVKPPQSLSVTVSIGAADAGMGGGDPDAILKKADEALYRAKKKGRNRVSK